MCGDHHHHVASAAHGGPAGDYEILPEFAFCKQKNGTVLGANMG